ncbi:MAG: DUF3795 domain-containing protein [Asgard group archaeon]|nr:DUF3795 domain-containing protein [Asgard group archaeon]
MVEMISKCGMLCSSCPWSKAIQDSMSNVEYEQYKKGCKETLGYAPSGPFQNCVGCQTPEDQWPKGSRLPFKSCTIRNCVMKSNIENCVYCSRFPCESIELKAKEWSREKIEKKHNKIISEPQYRTYVEPFEAYKRLQKVRLTIPQKEIIEATIIPLSGIKIADYPIDQLTRLKNNLYYEKVYNFLKGVLESSLEIKDVDTYAQQERLKNMKKQLLRFLWIIGTFGEIDDTNQQLVVKANDFINNRFSETSLGTYSFLKNIIFQKLEKFGIDVKLNAELTDKGQTHYMTPTGALRNQGWQITFGFKNNAENQGMLIALQEYCQKLYSKFEKKAFSYFTRNDFTVLIE